VAGLLAEVHVTLRNLKVHKSEDVRAKTPLGTMTLGRYTLDLTVHEVHALLRPDAPRLRFGGNTLGLELPLQLASGAGRAGLRLQWDGRKLAGAVCGDLDLRRRVKGQVAPLRFVVRGEFRLASEGDALVARPRFRDVPLKLQIEPADETWQMLDELIQEQSAVCRAALRKVDVARKLREVVARGFPVTLPGTLLRPVRLPAGLQQELEVPGRGRARLTVRPIGLVVVPERFWYGADVAVTPPTPAPRP
jgi:hypothetical protein